MPQSSWACVGLIIIISRVETRPMWHSTHCTRAWKALACATGSSGCTAWHTLVQKALLLLYSHATIPPAVASATPIPTSSRASIAPAMVLRPSGIFISSWDGGSTDHTVDDEDGGHEPHDHRGAADEPAESLRFQRRRGCGVGIELALAREALVLRRALVAQLFLRD